MPPFVPPEPPIEPDDPTPPPALQVPLAPPEVGFGSPWAPADAENRDRILDWWRAWWRSVFFPWIEAWSLYWATQWARIVAYLNEWLDYAGEYIDEHAISGYSWRTTTTTIATTGTTVVTLTGVDQDHRPVIIGDFVSDQSQDIHYGIVVAVVDPTHAEVLYKGQLRGLVGFGWWTTATVIAHAGTTPVVIAPVADRVPQLNDIVVDSSASAAYGKVTVVTDSTHVTVAYIGTLQGPQGEQGEQGPQGDPGVVQAIVAGSNVTVDDTDPANPIVSASGSGFGVVETIVPGSNVTVDDTDPANPIVSASGSGFGVVETIVAGTNVTVDSTDPANPIVSATGGGGSGIVESVVAGDNVTVDDTDPANPIVSATGGGVVESVVAGSRITVDDTDPANPIVSTANGIPLNVFATIDRPPALVNGDAYFDSTLIIPVWSYGGEWRDSEGTPVVDPPEPDDVDIVGGGSGPTLTSYRLSPGFGGKNQFNPYEYVEFEGALFSGPVHDIPINPDPGDGNILLRFNGTTVTPIAVPGFVDNLGYIRTSGIWVVDDTLYLIVTTQDLDTFDTITYYMSYTTAGGFTNLPVSTDLGTAYVDHATLATDGSLYFSGEVPVGFGSKVWYAADAVTDPVQVEGESVTAVYDNYAVGNGGIAWSQGNEQMVRIVSGEWAFNYGTSGDIVGAYVFDVIGDVNNRGQAMIVASSSPDRHMFNATTDLGPVDLVVMQSSLGFYETGRVWIADPTDPLGDHVAFNVMYNGAMWAGATGVYLNGHAYIEVSDDVHSYLAVFAVTP